MLDRTPHEDLIYAANAALHALRSYQHGNAARGLAEEVADHLAAALTAVSKERSTDIEQLADVVNQIQTRMQNLLRAHDTSHGAEVNLPPAVSGSP